MDRQPPDMQPSNPSDPRATVVHVTGGNAVLPEIPGYRVIRKLGQGGMAAVYLANQIALDREVSIKVMERGALADETSMQRFENEARTIAKLSHPNIVAIYEIGRTTDGHLYYSMPFLPNGDLAQRSLDHDDARIIEMLRTLLSALDYAHQRGIVHRDVKLENVLFDGDNRPLLADFGIAMSRNEDVRITTAGFAVGSAGYMAPEQARGDAVDARADLYSVGVLTWELLTGALPFRSTDPLALALMHAQKDIPRLPPAKKHWQGFIDKAMAKEPAQRFANAREMTDTLDRIGRRSGPMRLRPTPVANARAATSPGNKWALLGTVAALAVAGGGYALRDRLPWHTPNPGAASPANATSVPAAANPPPAVASTAATSVPTASIATPSAPTTAPSPPATPPPPAASPTDTAESVAVGHARAALTHGNLIQPAGKSAVDLALAAWELSPGTPGNKALVSDVLQAVGKSESHAIAGRDDARAIALDRKAAVLDDATVGANAATWKSFRSATDRALAVRAATESANPAALAKTHALAAQIGAPQAIPAPVPPSPRPLPPSKPAAPVATFTPPPVIPPAANPAAKPKPANATPLTRGFVMLHGQIGIFPPAAISAVEVTRNDYAQFAVESGRPPADCGGKKANENAGVRQPLFHPRGWRGGFNRNNPARQEPVAHGWANPGFPQAGDHPVVCVSWADADAYARWRSQHDHRRYRLPSAAEWQMLMNHGAGGVEVGKGTAPARSGSPNAMGVYGLDGNVREWLIDCGSTGCSRRQVAGRSWRERGEDAAPADRPAGRGFDDVGFRLVEVLGNNDQGGAGR